MWMVLQLGIEMARQFVLIDLCGFIFDKFFEFEIFFNSKKAPNKLLSPLLFKFLESRDLTSAGTIFENS